MSYLSKKLQSFVPFNKKKKDKSASHDAAMSTGVSAASIPPTSGPLPNAGNQSPSKLISIHKEGTQISQSPSTATNTSFYDVSSLPKMTTSLNFSVPVDSNPGKLSLKDFEISRTLGTGSFGRVHLVKYRGDTEEYYAMKVMKKSKIVELKQVDHTINERNILARLKHPFIVHLFCTFQDAHNLYFVMEFIVGGELFSILRRAKVIILY